MGHNTLSIRRSLLLYAAIQFWNIAMVSKTAYSQQPTIPKNNIADTSVITVIEITAQNPHALSPELTKTKSITKEVFYHSFYQPFDEILQQHYGLYYRQLYGLGGFSSFVLPRWSASPLHLMFNGIIVPNPLQNPMVHQLLPLAFMESLELRQYSDLVHHSLSPFETGIFIRPLNLSQCQDRERLTINAGIASFDTYNASATLMLPFHGHIVGGSASYLSSRGEYPLPDNLQGSQISSKRQSSGFRHSGGSLYAAGQLGLWNYILITSLFTGNREIPGRISDLTGSNEQKIFDEGVVAGLIAGRSLTEFSTLEITTFWKKNLLRLSNNNFFSSVGQTEQEFHASDAAIKIRYASEIIPQLTSETFVDAAYSSLRSRREILSPVQTPGRWNISLSSSWKWALPGLEASVAFRGASFSDINGFTPLFSASAGIAVPFDSTLLVRGTGSYHTKAPGFQELYYFNNIETSFEPEYTLSLMFGIESRLTIQNSWRFFTRFSGFYHNIRHFIQFLPTSPVAGIVQQLNNVQQAGLQALITIEQISRGFSCTFTSTIQQWQELTGLMPVSERDIPYAPSILSIAAAEYTWNTAKIGSTLQYTGKRLTRSINTAEFTLDGFSTLNLFVEYFWKLAPIRVGIKFSADNVLDAGYEMLKGFPMPGRSFQIQFRCAGL